VFVVGAKGNQCVLLRSMFTRRNRSSSAVLATEWEELMWFDPDQALTPEILGRIVKQSVNRAMHDLKDEVRAGRK
jgi:hypothetical protein